MKDPKRAEKFRKLAESMPAKIEQLRRPMTQNSTPKRQREYASRVIDGDNLERGRLALLALADAWDRVVMNPPFERGQDAEHIRHAYSILKPGGRLVSIFSPGLMFREDKKASEFREWLADKQNEVTDLPDGSFNGAAAFRSTGVASKMIVIDTLLLLESCETEQRNRIS